MAEEKETKIGEIDEDVLETLKKQVDIGTSSAQEIRRCELNFLAELLSEMRDLNKAIEQFDEQLNIVLAPTTQKYFDELAKHFNEEVKKEQVRIKAERSHKKKKVTTVEPSV